jgi:ribonuclease HII
MAGLKDSKKLSKLQRQKLAAAIHLEAAAIGLGWSDPSEVDSLGLTAGVRLAMQRAIEAVTIGYDEVIIDGNYNFFPGDPKVRVLIRADDIIPAVSAASIVAKVARDKFMQNQALIYPDYGFEKHVGYGTKLHMEKLRIYGPCRLHRRSCQPVRLIIKRLVV